MIRASSREVRRSKRPRQRSNEALKLTAGLRKLAALAVVEIRPQLSFGVSRLTRMRVDSGTQEDSHALSSGSASR